MHDPFPFIVVIPVVIAAFVFSIAQSARTSDLPQRWARENGFRLLSCERKTFFRGPFFFRSSKSDKVYRISVEHNGEVREGYLRCRASVLGIFSDVTDVRWDVEPRERPHQPGFPVIFPDKDP